MTVALGHSNSTFDEAKKAVDAGVSVWACLQWNSCGLTHRVGYVVGAMYQLPYLCRVDL